MQLKLFNIDQFINNNEISYKEIIDLKSVNINKETVVNKLILLNSLNNKIVEIKELTFNYQDRYNYNYFYDLWELEEYYEETFYTVDEFYINTIVNLKIKIPFIKEEIKVKNIFKSQLIEEIDLEELILLCDDSGLTEFYDNTRILCIYLDRNEFDNLIFKVKIRL